MAPRGFFVLSTSIDQFCKDEFPKGPPQGSLSYLNVSFSFILTISFFLKNSKEPAASEISEKPPEGVFSPLDRGKEDTVRSSFVVREDFLNQGFYVINPFPKNSP